MLGDQRTVSRITPKLSGDEARAGPKSRRSAGRLVRCSVSLGCTRAAWREMLRARTVGAPAKDTASLRAPSSLLTSAFEPGRFLCKVPLVEAPHHPADDPPQEAGKRHGERHPGAVSRSRRLCPVIRFDRWAGRAADEPKPSTRFERCDRPLGGRHLRLHDSEAAAERERRAGVTEALYPRDRRRPLRPALDLAQNSKHHFRRSVDLCRDAELHSSSPRQCPRARSGAYFHPARTTPQIWKKRP